MAESAYARPVVSGLAVSSPPRHATVVRITHWLFALSFFGLVVSGIAILLAHPRLYWGETGAVGTPSLIDLPLPFVLKIPIRGPGRYVHFLSAWICVLVGLYYVVSGFVSGHFRHNLLPNRSHFAGKQIFQVLSNHLKLKRPTEEDAWTYNLLQRLAYLAVVFILFPLIIWTGLGMSPSVTSVSPVFATVLGGQQSARTIHFLLASLVVLFVVVHLGMVRLAGFTDRVLAMITGTVASRRREHE